MVTGAAVVGDPPPEPPEEPPEPPDDPEPDEPYDPDDPEPDDPERAAGELETHIFFLARLHQLVQFRLVTVILQAVDIFNARNDAATGEQQTCHDQFLDRIGIGARRIKHRYTAGTHVFNRNIIDTGTGAPYCLQRLGYRHIMHFERAQQDSVRMLYL